MANWKAGFSSRTLFGNCTGIKYRVAFVQSFLAEQFFCLFNHHTICAPYCSVEGVLKSLNGFDKLNVPQLHVSAYFSLIYTTWRNRGEKQKLQLLLSYYYISMPSVEMNTEYVQSTHLLYRGFVGGDEKSEIIWWFIHSSANVCPDSSGNINRRGQHTLLE